MALLLSLIGLYGVMPFVVTRRTRETGIRLALGATGASAIRLVLHDAVAMIAGGMVIALPCVAALGKLVQSQLFGVNATDPATVASAAAVLAAGALAAALIPAWRTSHVNPTDAPAAGIRARRQWYDPDGRREAFHVILQINFNLNVPAAEYHKMADSVAHAFTDVPGLKWKIWLLNPAAQEAGGIYLFDSQASVDAYLNGPLVAQLRGLTAVRNISVKQFEVMPEATMLTRGPVEGAVGAKG